MTENKYCQDSIRLAKIVFYRQHLRKVDIFYDLIPFSKGAGF